MKSTVYIISGLFVIFLTLFVLSLVYVKPVFAQACSGGCDSAWRCTGACNNCYCDCAQMVGVCVGGQCDTMGTNYATCFCGGIASCNGAPPTPPPDGGGGGGGGCTPESCGCGGGDRCVPNEVCGINAQACCSGDPGCGGGGGGGPPPCDPNNWGGCSAACGNGSQTNECGDSRGCCSECGPTWGACVAANNFSRIGTYNCGSAPITQACTGTITGTLFDATEVDSCAQMALAPKIPGGKIVAEATQNPPPITYTSGASNTSGAYTVAVRVPDTYTLSADMSGVDPLLGKYLNIPRYVCQSSSVAFTTQSQTTARDFGFWKVYDSWFQVIGGNIRAEGADSPAIQSRIPPTCTAAATCTPYLLRKNAAGTGGSSGFAVTGESGSSGGTVVSAYSGGNLSKLNEEAKNVLSYAKRQAFKENFDYFTNRLYSMGISPVSDFTAGERADLQKPDPSTKQPANSGRGAYYVTGDVTINTAWTVNAGESIVIFVNGNVTIKNTITVTDGGFLAIIASGNTTIDSSVGTATITSEASQVEGVFITDGLLTIASKSSGNNKVSDLKFVGAGTFVGWSGVNLARDYKDTATPQLGLSNNTKPIELFIGRPDFAKNAPDKMKRPLYDWQEVAP